MAQRGEQVILGIGIFLLSVGAGWFFFTSYPVTLTTFSLILIALGVVLVVVSLLSWQRPMWRGRGLVTALVLGIAASLLLTAGASALQTIVGGGTGPYTAQEKRTYAGAVSESSVYFEVANFNGLVNVSTWGRASYSVNLTVRARASMQGSDTSNLASFKTSLNSSVAAGVRRLVLNYEVPVGLTSALAVEVTALLPATQVSLDLSSSNGGIFLSRINGTRVSVSTSNGKLALDEVYVDDLTGTTSNGAIDGTINCGKATLTTSNGAITLALLSLRSGNYTLQTSNGRVNLGVSSSSSVGYNLDLATSNGVVTVNLPSISYSVDQRAAKRGQTTDFSSKPLQLIIRASTSNGNLDLNTL